HGGAGAGTVHKCVASHPFGSEDRADGVRLTRSSPAPRDGASRATNDLDDRRCLMLPFLDDHDTHYSLAVGGVHSLPGGRRLGIVSISSRQVVVAFVGTDPDWTGGITMRLGDTVHRGGLRLQLVQV